MDGCCSEAGLVVDTGWPHFQPGPAKYCPPSTARQARRSSLDNPRPALGFLGQCSSFSISHYFERRSRSSQETDYGTSDFDADMHSALDSIEEIAQLQSQLADAERQVQQMQDTLWDYSRREEEHLATIESLRDEIRHAERRVARMSCS